MEVVHQGDSITHAVIGGKAAITMKTDDSAHLMHMLSKALYKDSILAVCREVICNAWDSHIASGITDRPIEITLLDDTLVITDFGAGIPYDMMGAVYGTYGGSTKKDSSDQTGGFGLGCKSPFAYTEHFDVISTHNGERTMYKITKSSAEIGGKPGIIPISSFPHAENGLTVKIRLKDKDIAEFKSTIERVVRNGEILAKYNNVLMTDLLKFSEAPYPWLMTRMDVYPGEHNKIFVRYGNVIYPIDSHDDYADEYSKVFDRVSKFSGGSRMVNWRNGDENMKLVLLAEPDSLSIAPSRETLSMQEHTIKSIKKLLENFSEKSLKSLQPRLEITARQKVDLLVKEQHKHMLLTRRSIPMNSPTRDEISRIQLDGYRHNQRTVYDFAELVNLYMSTNYPSSGDFWVNDMKYRLKQMVKAGLLKPGIVRSFLKEWAELGSVSIKSSWFTRNVVGAISKQLRKKGLSRTGLYALDSDWTYTSTDRPKYHNTSALTKQNLRTSLPYLRQIVVLAYGKRNAEDRLPSIMSSLGHANLHYVSGEAAHTGVMVYIVNKKKEMVDKAREALKGFDLIDLTIRHSHEAVEKVDVEPKPRKARVKGYVALSAMYKTAKIRGEDGNLVEKVTGQVDFRRFLDEDVSQNNRILKPEFIFQQSMASGRYGSDKSELLDMSEIKTKQFMNLFAHLGAVTNSFPQVERAFKHDGVLSLAQWLHKKVNAMLDDPAWRARYANSAECITARLYDNDRQSMKKTSHEIQPILKLVESTPALATAFGLQDGLTHEERVLIDTCRSVCEFEHGRREIERKINLIYPSAAALELNYHLTRSIVLDLVDVTATTKLLNKPMPDEHRDTLISFVINAIKA